MTDMPQIVVSDSPAPTQLVVGVRQAILLIAGAVTALGAANIGNQIGVLAAFAGPIAAIITLVLGQIHTLHDHAKMKVMAKVAPEAVATVKAA